MKKIKTKMRRKKRKGEEGGKEKEK